MEIVVLTPNIGAEIQGVDLSRTLEKKQREKLYQAFCEHQVIFFRDQNLSPQQHLEFAHLFGKVDQVTHPKFDVVPEAPDISIVVNDQDRPPDINVWHTDLTYLREPPKACVLYCQETPAHGGDTLWASMPAVWQSLNPSLQSAFSSFTAQHKLPLENVTKEQVREVLDSEIDAIHDLKKIHPDTGRPYLYVNSVYTKRIMEISETESDKILSMLFNFIHQPEFQVRFKWRKHSLAVWDNRCTQHYAVADYYPQRRVMHRVSVSEHDPDKIP